MQRASETITIIHMYVPFMSLKLKTNQFMLTLYNAQIITLPATHYALSLDSHMTHDSYSSPPCPTALWWMPWFGWRPGWSESAWTQQTTRPPPDGWTRQSSPRHRTWPDQWRCAPWTWCPGPKGVGKLEETKHGKWHNGIKTATYIHTNKIRSDALKITLEYFTCLHHIWPWNDKQIQ